MSEAVEINPPKSSFHVASFSQPTIFARHIDIGNDEVWLLNPGRRYILNTKQVEKLGKYIESLSDLKNSAYYKPLLANQNLNGARIVVERHRDRGIGDLLFLTAPLNFIQHVTGGSCRIHIYALSDRAAIFYGNPALHNETALVGPLEYDALQNYDYHWFIENVTEYDEEAEQLNVYDALYKQLGLNYKNIEPKWKRPVLHVKKTDQEALDALFYMIWEEYKNIKLDLRRIPYYVVAPFSHSSLRSANYQLWVDLINELASYRPVLIVGQVSSVMPETDTNVNDFMSKLSLMPNKDKVVNLIGKTPIRTMVALIAKAQCVFCLDSGPLYMAQALRIPAISLWGPHHPGVRIGYDPYYMDLAIWNKEACPKAPCFAHSGFPRHKCPLGEAQRTCEVLRSIDVSQVLEKIQKVETSKPELEPFKAS
jgi:ADP-heptose:LPS heptosyltransferase